MTIPALNVATFMEGFPSLSETYILWHMSRLKESGARVELYPAHLKENGDVHPEVITHRLLDHVHAPPSWSPRTWDGKADAVRGFCMALAQDPVALARLIPHTRGASGIGWFQVVRHLAHMTPDAMSFDVLHAYFGPSGRRAQMLRDVGRFNAPLVTSFLGFDLNILPKTYGPSYYDALFERADCLCVSSQFMRSQIVALGAPEDRLRVLPIGLPVESFSFAPREIGEEGVLRMLTAARLVEVKGIEWGLRGMALARARGVKAHWDIFGDGPLRQHLEQTAQKLGLVDHVTFHGFVNMDEIKHAMTHAHVCLFPGVTAHDGAQEALGGAVLEAQAVGMPVIATNVGGIPEGFKPGLSGILIPEKDEGAVADAIVEMVNRQDEWSEMGRIGRAHVLHHYDCGTLNARWLRLYQAMSNGSLPSQQELTE